MVKQEDWGESSDDWNSGEVWGETPSKSDFEFEWDTGDGYSEGKDKRNIANFIYKQPRWIKIGSAIAGAAIAGFVLLQIGVVTKIQGLGLFRGKISAPAACLQSAELLGKIGAGTISRVVMNKALEDADRIKSQQSGNADIDEAMWAVADAAYLANDAVNVVTSSTSILDSLTSVEATEAAQAFTTSSEKLGTACSDVGNQVNIPTPSAAAPETPEAVDSVPGPSEVDLPERSNDVFQAPIDVESFIQRVQSATMEVLCFADPNSASGDGGSAFAVDISPLTGTVSTDVHIITNHHVIENCIQGGEIFLGQGQDLEPATLVDFDKSNDLAILRPSGTVKVALPASSEIRVGQWVMASGYPSGISQTVTFGQVTGRDPIDEWITSDALIGPGNSGGPLVNSRGDVIGVSSAILIDIKGIGLSVPIDRLCAKLFPCN